MYFMYVLILLEMFWILEISHGFWTYVRIHITYVHIRKYFTQFCWSRLQTYKLLSFSVPNAPQNVWESRNRSVLKIGSKQWKNKLGFFLRISNAKLSSLTFTTFVANQSSSSKLLKTLDWKKTVDFFR